MCFFALRCNIEVMILSTELNEVKLHEVIHAVVIAIATVVPNTEQNALLISNYHHNARPFSCAG